MIFFSPVPHLSCALFQKPHQMDQAVMLPFLSKLEWKVLCRHPISLKLRPLLSGSITRFTPKTKCHMHVAGFKEIHLPCSHWEHIFCTSHTVNLFWGGLWEKQHKLWQAVPTEIDSAKSFKSELDIHPLVYDDFFIYIFNHSQRVSTSNPPKGDYLRSYFFVTVLFIC